MPRLLVPRMKNVYDLAVQLQELTVNDIFGRRYEELRSMARELADAVRREKDWMYIPTGWTKTGIYGSCNSCGDQLRGCGIGYGPGGLTVCPDCHEPSLHVVRS